MLALGFAPCRNCPTSSPTSTRARAEDRSEAARRRARSRAHFFSARWIRRSPRPRAGRGRRTCAGLAKRIVLELEDGLFLVLHLMISGRLHWKPRGAKLGRKVCPRGFRFRERDAAPDGGEHAEAGLAAPGSRARSALRTSIAGESSRSRPALPCFDEALTRENHTVKRAPDRSAPLLRHRQRVLRRDPPPRAAVAGRS